MKKLFENFRSYVNEELTTDEKTEKKKLQAKENPSEADKKRLKAIQHK